MGLSRMKNPKHGHHYWASKEKHWHVKGKKKKDFYRDYLLLSSLYILIHTHWSVLYPDLTRHMLLCLLHPRTAGETKHGAKGNGSPLFLVPLTTALLLLR